MLSRLLFSLLLVFNVRTQSLRTDCPVQPSEVQFIHDSMLHEEVGFDEQNIDEVCLFKFFDIDTLVDLSNSKLTSTILNVGVEVVEFNTVPSAQIYSHCSNCVYEWNTSIDGISSDASKRDINSDSELVCHNSNNKNTNNRCFVGYSDVLRSRTNKTGVNSHLTPSARVFEFPHDQYVSSSILVSGSLWSEFFHYDSTDQYRLIINPSSAASEHQQYRQPYPAYVVTNPVFIIPMITFHVGHVLIDVLEQVYQSMMAHYGEVRLDSLLVFDVAGAPEKGVLIRKLRSHLFDAQHDVYGILLRLLTRNPVITMDSLQDDEFFRVNSGHRRVQGRTNSILFMDLHIGVDISKSYFYYGYNYHPLSFQQHQCSLNLDVQNDSDSNSGGESGERVGKGVEMAPMIDQLAVQYRAFRGYIVSGSRGRTGAGADAGAGGSKSGKPLSRGLFGSAALVLDKLQAASCRHITSSSPESSCAPTSASINASITISDHGVHMDPIEFAHLHTLFIQRHDSRIFSNLEELIVGIAGGALLSRTEAARVDGHVGSSDPCDATGGIVYYHSIHDVTGTGTVPFAIYNLQHTAFSVQLEMFAHTRIFIATAGTSIHNLMFLPPLSAVIIVMQHPSWCKWSWMYSNQAYLLNIYALVYCPEFDADHVDDFTADLKDIDGYSAAGNHSSSRFGDNDVEYYHWTRSFWSQGRRSSKMHNISVNIPKFNALYRQAMLLTAAARPLLQVGENDQTQHFKDTVCGSASRPGHLDATSALQKEAKQTGAQKRNVSGKRKLSEGMESLRATPGVLRLHTHSVKIEPLDDNAGWELSIHGEISMPPDRRRSSSNSNISGEHHSRNAAGAGSSQYAFSAFPRLTVCLHSFLMDDQDFQSKPVLRVDALGNESLLVAGTAETLSTRDRDLLRKYKYYIRRTDFDGHDSDPMSEFGPGPGSMGSMYSDRYSDSAAYFATNTWCYPIESFNYYADLKLRVTMPLHYFHMWLQTSVSGGKIHGSDTYLVIDCEVPIMFEGGSMASSNRARKPWVGANGWHATSVSVNALPRIAVSSADLQQRVSDLYGNIPTAATVALSDLHIRFHFIKVVCVKVRSNLTAATEYETAVRCREFDLVFDYTITAPKVYESVYGSFSTDSFIDKYYLDSVILQFCHDHDLASRQCMDVFVLVYRDVYLGAVLAGDIVAERDYPVQLPSVPISWEYFNDLQSREITFQYFEARQHRKRQIVPSSRNPFVFVHIDKSAGTTLREFIYESSLKVRADSGVTFDVIIPCHGALHCKTFLMGQHQLRMVPCKNTSSCLSSTITTRARANVSEDAITFHSYNNVAVIAGHFSWGSWMHLPTFATTSPAQLSPESPSYINGPVPKQSCLVVGRNPVTRFISYYYQRCFNSTNCVGYHTRLRDLGQQEVEIILWKSRHAEEVDANWKRASGLFENLSDTADNINAFIVVDDGLHDAACRQMLPNQYGTAGAGRVESTRGVVLDRFGRFDPNRYNGNGSSRFEDEEPVTAIPFSYPEELTEADVASALENVEQCVVGLVEEWALSKKMISFYFPWLQFNDQPDRRKMRLYSDVETEEDLPPWMVDMIRQGNQCDMRLYNKMVWMFEHQAFLLDHSIFL